MTAAHDDALLRRIEQFLFDQSDHRLEVVE